MHLFSMIVGYYRGVNLLQFSSETQSWIHVSFSLKSMLKFQHWNNSSQKDTQKKL